MAVLSITEHIDYLESKRRLAKTTIRNYRYAVKRLKIENIDTSALADTWNYLSSQLPEHAANGEVVKNGHYGYVLQVNGVIGSLLKFHEVKAKGAEFDMLRKKLESMRHVPDAYTSDQLKILLSKTKWSGNNLGLYRLLVFLIYSGVRISSAAKVKFSEMKPVDGVDGVYAVRVEAKGRQYDAIINKRAVEHMQFWNPSKSDLISGHRPETMKSSFSDYNRSRLAAAITSAEISEQVSVNTSIFNSIRKAYITRLEDDKIESDDMRLLLGLLPNTLAYKPRTTSGGNTGESITTRIAKAYANSSFMTWEAWP